MGAFEQLIEAYARRGWHLARASTFTADDADDVMQMAFIVAWRKQDDIPKDAWPWFAAVVVNCARNHRKKMARARSRESKWQPADTGPDRPVQAELAELREVLLSALNELPDSEREAVTLCLMGGLTQQQASEQLGVAHNTLKSQVNRGLERLRRRLGPQPRGLEAYLGVLAFPPPVAGWDAAVSRWRDGAVSSPAGVFRPGRVVLAGVASVSLTALSLLVAWTVLIGQPPPTVVTPPDPTALVPDQAATFDADPRAGATPEADLDQAGPQAAEAATEQPAENAPAVTDIAPLPAEEPDHVEIQPGGQRRVGSTRVRIDYWRSGPIYTQFVELMTESGPVLHGPFRMFHEDGKLKEAGEFVNGLREGMRQTFYEDGAPACRGDFRAGQPHGHWVYFHENGVKQAEGMMDGGVRQGPWRGWQPNGEPLFEETYVNGKRNGVATRYDEQGHKVRETTWQDGLKHGPEIEYDAEGNAQPPKIYENGKLKQGD
ncbi:MAG: sigma-70 family RNA polymerase sigma factor [Planctomycetes bacterium]|nr:sigma-70 family RNA polymerase sigma factor [Planctomycetota bacterium]MCB9935951.1 sigma-70 family RNA polymerase sigma factor [Planctomycetota bacterium]